MPGYRAWTQSQLIQPPVILGRRLRPFSLFHRLILREKFISAFLDMDRVAGRADVILAVMICSRTRKEIIAKLARGGGWLNLLTETFLARVYNWKKAAAQFEEYIGSYSYSPDGSVPGKATVLHGPIEYHLFHTLCSEYNYSKDQAWDTSFCEAMCQCDIVSEKKGGVVLRTIEDEMLSRAVLQLDDAEKAKDSVRVAELSRVINVLTSKTQEQ
jgi:hypothetical protein